MNIQSETTKSGEVTLTVTLPPETVAAAEKTTFTKLAKTLKHKGFRKGKVPAAIVRQQITDGEIRARMVQDFLPKWYVDAVREQKLSVLGEPKLELVSLETDKPLVFKAVLPVFPEVKLPDYRGIKVKKTIPKVSKKDIDHALENLRLEQVRFEIEAKPAAKDDVAHMHVKAWLGEEELKAYTREDYELSLGDGYFAPKFDEQIYGLVAGDEKTFDLTMPDDYPIERFKSQTLKFQVNILNIKRRILPTVNDEFARQLGIQGVAELRDLIEKNLEQVKLKEAAEAFQKAVMDALVDKSAVVVPEVIVHEEVHKMEHELEWRLSQQGFTMEQFLKSRGQEKSALMAEWHPQAERVAKLGMLLDVIAPAESITVSRAELDHELEAWLLNYRGKDGKLTSAGKKMKQSLSSVNGRAYLTQLLGREKTRRRIFEIVEGETSPKV